MNLSDFKRVGCVGFFFQWIWVVMIIMKKILDYVNIFQTNGRQDFLKYYYNFWLHRFVIIFFKIFFSFFPLEVWIYFHSQYFSRTRKIFLINFFKTLGKFMVFRFFINISIYFHREVQNKSNFIKVFSVKIY